MLIDCNINNIAIFFYGPLFHFLRGIGRPGPRALNVSSLSLGYKHILKNKKEGIIWQKQVVVLL